MGLPLHTMLKKMNLSSDRQRLIVYVVLIALSLFVFSQVGQFDFITFDDPVYVVDNPSIQSGFTMDGVIWAFGTIHAEFWHPLTWLSLMLDYQLFGLNAGGYHITNLMLHILSTLMLFWLLHRMTGAVWRSAFVAALFAIHPLHVETVVWIAKRKDVLSAFFWMLTLCLYVYYTEKPVIKRYLFVFLSFACALMSKPMAVTLPVIMIVLDYWPLKRFASKKENPVFWQVKEKLRFFMLSAVFSLITIFAQYDKYIKHAETSFDSRLANAPVSLTTYLAKTLWPYDLAVFYPFSYQLPAWQTAGSIALILAISVAVILAAKRLPYLLVGWLWYVLAVLPVLDIFRSSARAMSDNYTYLPAVGLYVMAAWGIPDLFCQKQIRRKILWPAGIAVAAMLSVLAWQQCSYWQNSFKLFNHALHVTKDNYLAYNQRGNVYSKSQQYPPAIADFNEAIRIKPDYAFAFNNRGNTYLQLGRYQQAISDYSEAIRLNPDYARAYYNRGFTYGIHMGRYQRAIDDLNEAIRREPDAPDIHLTRGIVYSNLGGQELACLDYQKACDLGNCKLLDMALGKGECLAADLQPHDSGYYHNSGISYFKRGQYRIALGYFTHAIHFKKDFANAYHNRGTTYSELGRYQHAVADFNESIRLNPGYPDAYKNRGIAYLLQGEKEQGCSDFKKACALGDCKLLELAESKGDCR